MIIIKDKYGQLCNRLWAYSPVISKVLETGEKIDILNFYDYHKYFENLELFDNIIFRKKYRLLHHMYIKIPEKYMWLFKPLRKEFWDKNNNERLVFLNGWANKDICDNLNREQIKNLFKPVRSSVIKVDQLLEKERKKYDLIIGVHIRKGDYETFRNGVFFYSDEVYAQFMRQLMSKLPENKRIGFLICSNSAIDKSNFSDLEVFQLIKPNLIEDLYALSNCDFIIGPPSTYSMWASFYGNKPLRFLMSKHEKINIEDFSPIVAENTFANGNKLEITAI